MITVRADFNSRSKEIDDYFDFVQASVSSHSSIAYRDSTGATIQFPITTDLHKTLKATGFLLIYNLVESTMSNAIEAIYEELKGKKVGFDLLKKELKVIILKNLKKWNPEKVQPKLNDMALDVVFETFRKDELFSGNVDARKIREIIREYGISISHSANGDHLLTVKERRNDLAHGVISFADCGSTTTMSELITYKDEAKAYLAATLKDIEDYLSNAHYK